MTCYSENKHIDSFHIFLEIYMQVFPHEQIYTLGHNDNVFFTTGPQQTNLSLQTGLGFIGYSGPGKTQ